jgi:hypothetical protein
VPVFFALEFVGMFFRPSFGVLMLALAVGPAVVAAELKPETLAAWREYRSVVEQRRARELADGSRFLVLDFLADHEAERRALTSGAVVVREMPAATRAGRDIDVPSGLIHHWRGAVLVRGVTVAELLTRLEQADPPAIQQDVIRSSVLARGPNTERVFLRLQRTKIVTAVFNTEHDVTFRPMTGTRAASTSVASKIAEVRDPGTPQERELPPGSDRGFLWRLNAYWRYEATAGGVIAECESITLSRSVPSLVRFIASPLINGAAEESMQRTLEGLRQRYSR